MQGLGGSSCNLAETQRPRLAYEGARQNNPSFRTKRTCEGRFKKSGELLTALSLHAEARGFFLQPCRDPATQGSTRMGSANNPSVQTKRICEGRTKKSGGPLTALSLRAEAQGLLLHPRQRLTTKARAGSFDKNAIKGIEPITVQGFEGWAP